MDGLLRYQLFARDRPGIWSARCVALAYRAAGNDSIRQYVEEVLEELRAGKSERLEEAIHVAVPLIYRFAIDDTSRGYRVGAELKEECCRLKHPDFYCALRSEVECLCRSYCGLGYGDLNSVLESFLMRIQEGADYSECDHSVYGRAKGVYSIFEKLLRYSKGAKALKCSDPAVARSMRSVLGRFERNMLARLSGTNVTEGDYSREDVKWVLPDLLASTVQFRDSLVHTKNLGVLKQKYKAIFGHLERELSAREVMVYFGPAYSKKWHMNRMVFYTRTPQFMRVPMEVFVRTDRDYFIGYANYWRYKNVDLLASSSPDDIKRRSAFIRELKSCTDFRQVQELVFRQATSGQLCLF